MKHKEFEHSAILAKSLGTLTFMWVDFHHVLLLSIPSVSKQYSNLGPVN